MNSFRCRAQGILSVFLPVMILIAVINGSVFAQWSRTAPNIYPATITDKVGVGTTTPSDVLDVRMPSSVNQAGLTISGPTVTGNGSQPAVVFKRYNGSTLNTVSKVYSNNGDILFTTGTGTSPSDRMIIDNAGRVGIGTMTPGVNYKLDVNGVFHVVNGNQALFSNSGTAALPSISFDNDQNTGLFNPGNADVIGFATQGTERMRIDQIGNVGIGMSPNSMYKLDVNGVLHVANGFQALFSQTSTANAPAIAFDNNNNSGVFSPSDDNLCLATGGQERLRINPNGYVGINTTNPGNGQAVSLHVNGPVMLTSIPALGGAATYYLGIEGSTGIVKTRTPAQVFSDISGGACPPNPMTALGDMIYGATAGACTRFPGNTAATKKFLSQTGTGSASAMPAWLALTSADVGLGNVENTALSTWAGSANITAIGTLASGSVPWARITGAPAVPPAQVNSDWNAASGMAQILNKPTIPAAQVSSDWNATSGVAQILNKPTIPTLVNSDWNATSGIAQILNKPIIPAAQVSSDWAAISGVSQILNKPIIPDPQVSSDWNATSGIAQILNKPIIPAAQVSSDWAAISGVSQILNKPIIPDPQVSSDWNATSGIAQILNKPIIPAAQVSSDWNATSGVEQILNKPTIPPPQVNSDWNAQSGLAQILNKPTTLKGYGITDAAPLDHGVTVGYMPYANSTTTWAASPISMDGSDIAVDGDMSFSLGKKLTLLKGELNAENITCTADLTLGGGHIILPNVDLLVDGGNMTVSGPDWKENGSPAYLYLGDNNHYLKSTWGEGVSIGTYDVGDALKIGETTGDVTVPYGTLSVDFGSLDLGISNLTYSAGNLTLSHSDMTVKGQEWDLGRDGVAATCFLGDGNHYIRARRGYGVSIGTFEAQDALTIKQTTGEVIVGQGDLTVSNGKINVKGWSIEEAPDYVFEKDYKLPKLNEVETYVKEHKHLADVPSAKDMNKNGLDITSMNMKLLKKIEELTLYSIEQNKKLEMQNKRIEELEKKVGR